MYSMGITICWDFFLKEESSIVRFCPTDEMQKLQVNYFPSAETVPALAIFITMSCGHSINGLKIQLTTMGPPVF